jgi:DNA-binding NtrC family response regulator
MVITHHSQPKIAIWMRNVVKLSKRCQVIYCAIVIGVRQGWTPGGQGIVLVMDNCLAVYIDNSPIDTMLMEIIVGKIAGLELICAGDLESGSALILEKRPGLLLIDLSAPALRDVAVLERLSLDGSLQRIPIIAFGDEDALAAGTLAGHSGRIEHLVRPLNLKHLSATIKDCLSIRE